MIVERLIATSTALSHQHSANGKYLWLPTAVVNGLNRYLHEQVMVDTAVYLYLLLGVVLLVFCRLTVNGNGFTPLPVWLAWYKHTRQ